MSMWKSISVLQVESAARTKFKDVVFVGEQVEESCFLQRFGLCASLEIIQTVAYRLKCFSLHHG